MLRLTVTISTFILLLNCLKLAPMTDLTDKNFYQKAGIKYDENQGKINSKVNTMVYFFIQGQQSNQIVNDQKTQFQNTRYSYLKALHQSISEKQENFPAIVEEQLIAQTDQLKDSQEKQPQKQQPFHIQFYSVSCTRYSQQDSQKGQITENSRSICQILGLGSTVKSRLILFTQSSELIEFRGQIKEENMIFFISKVKGNFNPQTRTVIFDQELAKICGEFETETSFQHKAIGLVEGLTQYLTWDALKFFIVFLVIPFLFGYVSTKLQQRANQQRIKKYEANLEQDHNKSGKSSKKLANNEKQKEN